MKLRCTIAGTMGMVAMLLAGVRWMGYGIPAVAIYAALAAVLSMNLWLWPQVWRWWNALPNPKSILAIRPARMYLAAWLSLGVGSLMTLGGHSVLFGHIANPTNDGATNNTAKSLQSALHMVGEKALSAQVSQYETAPANEREEFKQQLVKDGKPGLDETMGLLDRGGPALRKDVLDVLRKITGLQFSWANDDRISDDDVKRVRDEVEAWKKENP